MSHLLDQLELEVLVADPAEARQLQERLSRLHHQVLAEVLARVLDQLSPPGTLHRLESLTLELGAIPADQLERQFPERLERALRQTLPSRLLTAQRRPQPATDPLALPRPDQAPNPTVSDRDPLQDVRPARPPQDALDPSGPPGPASAVSPGAGEPGRSTRPGQGAPAASSLELLGWFAATGTLPWWAPRHDPRLIPTAFAAALHLPETVLGPFLRQLAATPTAQQRLLASLDPDQRPRLLEALPRPTTQTAPQGPLPETTPTPDPAPPPQSTDLTPPQPVHDGPPDSDTPDPAGHPLELLAAFAQTGTLPAWAPRHDAAVLPAAFAAALRLHPEALAPLLRQLAAAPAARERLLAALDPAQRPQLLAALQTAALAPPATPLTPEPPGPPPLQREDSLTVEGAGLVLLWPFLATLFERLGWLTPEQGFIGAAAQQRAMALLGYLVDGDPHPPEWRLTLAKLLCGLPLDAVCVLTDELNPLELAEADKLLQAALVHGNGLLGDDVESLRATWLQRPGLLSWRTQAWLLAVEQRDAVDGALERLPWGVSWLRLPWMVELVQVGW